MIKMAAYSILVKMDNFDPELGVARYNLSIDDEKIEKYSGEELERFLETMMLQEINRNIGWAAIRSDH